MPIMPRARRRRVQARAKRHLANAGAALAYHEGFAGDYSTFVVANEDGPGIGIDLTANYGTCAAHFSDGTTKDLALIEGSSEYRLLMQSLSILPNPIPLTTGARVKRWIRRQLGRPATQEVAIIGQFIRQISESSQSKLPETIDKVVLSAPLYPALTQRDMNDAIVYAGLRSWLKVPVPYPEKFAASRTAFGTTGYGECKHYQGIGECPEDWEDLPIEPEHIISLSRDARTATIKRFSRSSNSESAFELPEFNEKSEKEIMGSVSSWAYIRDRIRSPPRRSLTSWVLSRRRKIAYPECLIAVRDRVADEPVVPVDDTFTRISMDVDFPSARRAHKPAHPVYAAARGAALYARWRQEAPTVCVEEAKHGVQRKNDAGVDPIRMKEL